MQSQVLSWNQVSDLEYFVWKSRTITMTFMKILAPVPWNFDDVHHDYEEHGVNDDWQVLLLPFSDDNICTMSCILLRLVAIDVTTTSFCIFHILLFSFVDKPNSILFQQSTLPALPSRSV